MFGQFVVGIEFITTQIVRINFTGFANDAFRCPGQAGSGTSKSRQPESCRGSQVG